MAEKDQDHKVTRLERRIAETAADIMEDEAENPEYLHSVLCQVGLPRASTSERSFERFNGKNGISIQAGKVLRRSGWIDAALPYGAKPRLVLVHVCSEAVRTRSNVVEVGRTLNEFLKRIGADNNGPSYARFKNQMEALAVCRMQIGMWSETRSLIINTQPISKFEAWIQHDNGTLGMWPGVIELSSEFYDSIVSHAVPLDPRAIHALQGSALALDIYSWLAHRLWRVRADNGMRLFWKNLRAQFGQEYRDDKNFKKEFVKALRKVKAVYPDARIDEVRGGLRLYPSPPPIRKTNVLVKLPESQFTMWPPEPRQAKINSRKAGAVLRAAVEETAGDLATHRPRRGR